MLSGKYHVWFEEKRVRMYPTATFWWHFKVYLDLYVLKLHSL